jgi:hypothetical protein
MVVFARAFLREFIRYLHSFYVLEVETLNCDASQADQTCSSRSYGDRLFGPDGRLSRKRSSGIQSGNRVLSFVEETDFDGNSWNYTQLTKQLYSHVWKGTAPVRKFQAVWRLSGVHSLKQRHSIPETFLQA